jgi:hypothetical protein
MKNHMDAETMPSSPSERRETSKGITSSAETSYQGRVIPSDLPEQAADPAGDAFPPIPALHETAHGLLPAPSMAQAVVNHLFALLLLEFRDGTLPACWMGRKDIAGVNVG